MKTTFKTPTMATIKSNAEQFISKTKETNDKIMGKEENNRLNTRLANLISNNHVQPDGDRIAFIKAAEKLHRTRRETNSLVTGIAAGAATTTVILSSAAILTKLVGCAAVGAVAYKGLEFINNRTDRSFIKDQIEIAEYYNQQTLTITQ